MLPLDGGEPWQLTSLKHGVGAVHWSPDGSRLALEAQAGDHRFVVGEERKGRSPIARRITRLDFRDDESGHVVRRSHLWLMPFRAGAAPRQLTSGDFDVLHPAWSPDGRRIAFAADRGPDSTINPRLQIWSVGTDAAKPRVRELASLAGDADRPSFSPDGRRLAFIGTDVDDPPDEMPPSLWVMDLPSGTPERADRRAGPADRRVGVVRPPDGRGGAGTGVALERRARRHRRRPRPRRSLPRRRSTGRPTPMIDPDLRIAACGLDVAGDRVAISAALDGRAGEVWAVEDGALRQVTREGSAWQRRFDGVELEELSLPGPAGPIQAWLASPRGAGRKRLPDDPPHPRRPDGGLGPGWHARRDGAVRGRLPRADAEHPRLDDVRRPVGARACPPAGATPTPRTRSRRSTAS